MRYVALLAVALLPFLSGACATIGMGASTSAGQDINYYLDTHEIPERVAEVTGSDEPSNSGEQGDVWQFENDGEIVQVAFDDNGRATNVHRIG